MLILNKELIGEIMFNKAFFVIFKFLISLLIVGCVSGPKDPGRTFAEKLSGDNYESPGILAGVPILTRKPVQRKISGRIFCGEGASQIPLNHAQISIRRGNYIVTSSTSDPDGRYMISAVLDPEFSHELRVTSKCGDETINLLKDFKVEQKDQNFFLKK